MYITEDQRLQIVKANEKKKSSTNTVIFSCGNTTEFHGNFHDIFDMKYTSKRKKRNKNAFTYKVNMTRDEFWYGSDETIPDNILHMADFARSSKCSRVKFDKFFNQYTNENETDAIILPFAR